MLGQAIAAQPLGTAGLRQWASEQNGPRAAGIAGVRTDAATARPPAVIAAKP